MKQKLLFILLLLFGIKSFSQDSKTSLEINYPIPIDKNFLGKNYNGIIDFGTDFRFVNLNLVNFGASINAGILQNNSNQNNGPQDFKVTSYIIQPRVYGELDLEAIDKFYPSIGIGYTIMIFNATETNNGFDVSEVNNNQSRFNLNFGIS